MKTFTSTIAFLLLFLANTKKLAGQCSTPATIPFYESFDGITNTNELPPCWAASNMSVTCLTFTTPTKRASFYYQPSGANYFYSRGIQLYPGITYSTALWHKVISSASTTWTDLSILMGSAQTPAAQTTTLASTGGPVLNTAHAALSNTFIVSSAGVYYFSIRGTSTGAGSVQNLEFDDFQITIPCNAGANSPNLSLSISASTICAGTQVSLTASGANTYTWTTSITGTNVLSASASIQETPQSNITYVVKGTNSLTGCSIQASAPILVKPSPDINVVADKNMVCSGKQVNLSVFGATTYTLDGIAPFTSVITVTPSTATNYTIVGTGTNGCVGNSTIIINTYALPAINLSTNHYTLCESETATVVATGAATYTWSGPGSPAILSGTLLANPSSNATYTVTGMDTHGCENTATVALSVNACAGLVNINASGEAVRIYPNPGRGEYTVEIPNGVPSKVFVFDLTGKQVFECTLDKMQKGTLNIRSLPNGIYFVKVQNDVGGKVYRLIKE